MSTNTSIRMATSADAQALLEIYAPYITETAITFEYEIPSVSEFAERIAATLQKYPYIVALDNHRIVGYAYASSFKSRAAYDWAVETSVYVARDCQGKGWGKKLYIAIEEILKQQNILNLNACIACTVKEDPHLNNNSVLFHEHLGYKKVAHFTQCGYKFNTWYDMIWMEKILGKHEVPPRPMLPVTELNA